MGALDETSDWTDDERLSYLATVVQMADRDLAQVVDRKLDLPTTRAGIERVSLALRRALSTVARHEFGGIPCWCSHCWPLDKPILQH